MAGFQSRDSSILQSPKQAMLREGQEALWWTSGREGGKKSERIIVEWEVLVVEIEYWSISMFPAI